MDFEADLWPETGAFFGALIPFFSFGRTINVHKVLRSNAMYLKETCKGLKGMYFDDTQIHFCCPSLLYMSKTQDAVWFFVFDQFIVVD